MPDPIIALVIFLLLSLWLATVVVVVAACRMAAAADRGEHLARSKPAPADDVADGAQQYLEVAPKRPVRHVQVVDSSHFA